MLYHYQIGFPKINTNFGRLELRYSQHAIHASVSDCYGDIKLPRQLNTEKAKLVEIEVENDRVIKAVYRVAHCEQFDLVIVVIPARALVKTVWLNSKTDKHQTLNRYKYATP